MIVAITGGTGFVGSGLVLRHLAMGDIVRLLSRQPIAKLGTLEIPVSHQGDLTNENFDPSSFVDGADILYHCAGEIFSQPKMHLLHVLGTQKLIEAARAKIGKWIQLSSVGAYGPQHDGAVITEITPPKPVGVYETTKLASDKLVSKAVQENAFPGTILRPSNVFGESMNNQSIYHMISMIKKGLFFFIGKPGASANYIYVDNIVEGLIRCGEKSKGKGEIYNLSDYCTIEKFVSIISENLDKSPPRLRFPGPVAGFTSKLFEKIPGFPLTSSRVAALLNRAVYSTKKIEQELGYSHLVSIEEGLVKLVAEFERRA
jgi:nucleoside-diphosphate-sugar epimerase